MALSVPIRYINDGEPLNEETLNRYGLDSQTNLEVLFSTVDGYDPGTVEAEANRVVLRDDQGRSKFGVPLHDQHAWRVAEYKVFREFLLDNADYIRLERLRKASTSQEGIVQLIDSYTSNSIVKAPTAKALHDAYKALDERVSDLEDAELPEASTTQKGITQYATLISQVPDDTRETLSTTPKAVFDFVTGMIADNVPEETNVLTWDQIKNNNPSIYDYGADNEADYASSAYASRVLYQELKKFIESFTTKGVGYDMDIRSGAFRLPNGMIVQAGNYATSADGTRLLEPPIAFPNGVWCCVASELSADGWYDWKGVLNPTVYGIDFWTSGLNAAETKILKPRVWGARVMADGSHLGGGLSFTWIAMGH